MPTAQQRRDLPSIVAIADAPITRGQLVCPADGSDRASVRVAPCGASQQGLGIADNTVGVDGVVHVFIEGVHLLETTSVVEAGDFATSDVGGTVKKAAAGDPVVGMFLADGNPGENVTVHLRQQMAQGLTGGSTAYNPDDPSDWIAPPPTMVGEALDELADRVANLGLPETFILQHGFYHATLASLPDIGAFRYEYANGLRTPTMPFDVEIYRIVFQWVDEPSVAAREVTLSVVEPYPTKLNLSMTWTLDRTHPSVITDGSLGSARRSIIIDSSVVSPFSVNPGEALDFVIPSGTPFPRIQFEHFGDVNHNPSPARFDNYGQMSAFFFCRRV